MSDSYRGGLTRPRRRLRRIAAFVGIVSIGSFTYLAFARREVNASAVAQAELAYRRNDLPTSMNLARRYLASNPNNRAANSIVARCLSRLGRPKEAESFYEKAGTLDREGSHTRAMAWVVANARETAMAAFREHLERWPDDALALSRLGAVQISQSRWNDAQATAGRLARLPDGIVLGHTLAGVVYSRTGEAEEAAAELSRVLELDPHLKAMPLKPRSMFWAELGKNLLRAGRVEEARQHLQRGLGEGDAPVVADLLGQADFLGGAFDEAEHHWRLALQRDPQRYGTWWRLGKLELQRKRPAEALEPLGRSIELEPRAGGPLYSLSLAYRMLGRVAESEAALRMANGLRDGPADSPVRNDRDALDLTSAALDGGEATKGERAPNRSTHRLR